MSANVRLRQEHLKTPLYAKFKNQSLLTLNFRGENHDKGLAEDASVTASGGIVYPLEALVVSKNMNS